MFGSVSSKKMEVKKRLNFEIDLRPLKFSPKHLRPLIFCPKIRDPLKHSGRVFPINNVHPLSKYLKTRKK